MQRQLIHVCVYKKYYIYFCDSYFLVLKQACACFKEFYFMLKSRFIFKSYFIKKSQFPRRISHKNTIFGGGVGRGERPHFNTKTCPTIRVATDCMTLIIIINFAKRILSTYCFFIFLSFDLSLTWNYPLLTEYKPLFFYAKVF